MIWTIFAVFAACFLAERTFPGWPLPCVRTWPIRVLAINAAQLAIMAMVGLMWQRCLSSISVFQISEHAPPVVAGFIAYFVATFVFYWWHRWRHEVQWLWVAFHQIHHSPQRLEVITSLYKHPGEMLVDSIIGLGLYTLLGLSLEAGAWYTLFAAFAEFFYHANIRTPRWIGFFFQRPEMHRVHHQYGRHKNNYGDITWWDMMFGTYENPREWTHTCGYDDATEQRLFAMLTYHDVHRVHAGDALAAPGRNISNEAVAFRDDIC